MASYKMKFDPKRCILCDACLVHCKVKNKIPTGLSLNRLDVEGPKADDNGNPKVKVKYQNCKHCKKPLCVPASKGALSKREEDGLVLIDETKPVNKQTALEIIEACPWSIPVFNEDSGKLLKCDWCFDRLQAGEEPACVVGCTTKALTFVVTD